MMTRFIVMTSLAFILASCNNSENKTKSSVALGEQLFHQKHIGKNKTIGCIMCHSVKPNEETVGPNLQGISTRAALIKHEVSAESYLRKSIIDPDAYIVPSYTPGVMVTNYADELSEAEIESLVLYLQTL